jgi:RimJ/RimL family protein N-acetyltransferase
MELAHPDPPLADEVVALRPWRDADLPALVEGFADPLVHRFSWPLNRPYTEEDGRDFLAAQEQERLAGTALNLALADPRDETALLGGASIHEIDAGRRKAAVGYWLRPEARGRGVATRATRLLAAYATQVLRVERLELTAAPDNEASMRVADRCGFTYERLILRHLPWKGGWRDTVVFALRR